MEPLKDVFKIIRQGVWMVSVDLKDAFFPVSVHKSHQKYFEWFRGFYKFIGMPNGYSEAMRILTNIFGYSLRSLDPVFGYLRQEGHFSLIFVDDSYLQRNTESECLENIQVTVNLLIKLEFKIHELKLILKPNQELEFLGSVINTKNKTISINKDQSEHTIIKTKNLSSDSSPSIRKLPSVIGPLISLFPAIPFGNLHYRNLEKEKTKFLKKSASNYEAKVRISTFATDELKWWLHAILNAMNNINIL